MPLRALSCTHSQGVAICRQVRLVKDGTRFVAFHATQILTEPYMSGEHQHQPVGQRPVSVVYPATQLEADSPTVAEPAIRDSRSSARLLIKVAWPTALIRYTFSSLERSPLLYTTTQCLCPSASISTWSLFLIFKCMIKWKKWMLYTSNAIYCFIPEVPINFGESWVKYALNARFPPSTSISPDRHRQTEQGNPCLSGGTSMGHKKATVL